MVACSLGSSVAVKFSDHCQCTFVFSSCAYHSSDFILDGCRERKKEKERKRKRERERERGSFGWFIDFCSDLSRGDQHKGAEDGAATKCFFIVLFHNGHRGKHGKEKERQGSHRGGLHVGGRSTPADRWLGLERTGRNSEINHSQSGSRPLQTVLTNGYFEVEKAGEIRRGDDWSVSGSAPGSHLRPQPREVHSVAMDLDSTMGYPGEARHVSPIWCFMERCSECDLSARRVSRAGKAGKCEICKNDKERH